MVALEETKDQHATGQIDSLRKGRRGDNHGEPPSIQQLLNCRQKRARQRGMMSTHADLECFDSGIFVTEPLSSDCKRNREMIGIRRGDVFEVLLLVHVEKFAHERLDLTTLWGVDEHVVTIASKRVCGRNAKLHLALRHRFLSRPRGWSPYEELLQVWLLPFNEAQFSGVRPTIPVQWG